VDSVAGLGRLRRRHVPWLPGAGKQLGRRGAHRVGPHAQLLQDRRRDALLEQPGQQVMRADLGRPVRGGFPARPLQSGTAPAPDWLRQAARELGLGDSAVAELEAADLVHLDGGAVTVAYPFSGTPTRQRVELDGFPAVYAMCAIDALGIPVMAGRDGRIAATDPHDGAPVVVSVRAGQWRWTPAGAVVVFARTADCGTDCTSWEVLCPHTTFHVSRDNAQAYLSARDGIEGKILDQQAAVERGRRNFGPMLGGPA